MTKTEYIEWLEKFLNTIDINNLDLSKAKKSLFAIKALLDVLDRVDEREDPLKEKMDTLLPSNIFKKYEDGYDTFPFEKWHRWPGKRCPKYYLIGDPGYYPLIEDPVPSKGTTC